MRSVSPRRRVHPWSEPVGLRPSTAGAPVTAGEPGHPETRFPGRDPISQPRGDFTVPARPPSRPAYDPWRDAYGAQIPQHCRIEQVAVDKIYGALPSRLHKRGQVIGRGTTRINVRFDDENKLVRIRPHLVRVLDKPGDFAPRTVASSDPGGRDDPASGR